MKVSEVIDRLNTLYNEHGDVEVLSWKNIIYGSSPILSIEYKAQEQFNESLSNDKEYMKNFNNEVNKIIIM